MNLETRVRKILRGIASSIAFYPGIIALSFLVFSFLIVSFEYKPFLKPVHELLDGVLVKNPDNARLILGTLMGSLISLVVFSFSMVMIVLGQASSTLSPRVIPALVGKKYHQIVLGIDLGVIIYCLILIVNISDYEGKVRVPSIGILLAIIFGITCLGMFIYFIDSISRSIQVDSIMQEIFRKTRQKLYSVDVTNDKELAQVEKPDDKEWIEIKTHETGYLKQIHIPTVMSVAKSNDAQISITANPGFFLVKNYPFMLVNKSLKEEDLEKIRSACIFYTEENVIDHYLFGFKQISEIAVKALSPGINDPGTAVKAIDLLSILFITRMNITEKIAEIDSDGSPRVYFSEVTLDQLLYQNLIPIREYGKSDVTVMLNVLECLKNLVYADSNSHNYERVLVRYIQDIRQTIMDSSFSPLDHIHINFFIRKINKHLEQSDPIEIV